jgi:hypothetical protein
MIDLLLFLLGIHLCIRLISSCYGIFDLWYCWRQHWYKVLAKISIRLAVIVLIGLLSTPVHHLAFLAGIGFFALFHITAYWIGQLIGYHTKQ